MTPHAITSLQNPRVKAAIRLRDARQRHKQGRLLIDGARELLRAIEAGVPLIEVFVCRERCTSDDARQALERLKSLRGGTPLVDVTPAVFEKLAFGHRAEGLLAVASPPPRSIETLRLPDDPLVVLIEGVEKPGNVGAIVRSADGAGASAVIVVDGGTDLYNPNAIRASLGTIFTLPVYEATSADALAWLRRRGLTMFAARVDATTDYTAADFSGPTAIILGSEARGLSSAWHGEEVKGVRLPMLGAADSLNVSATAAVLLYEALRQRRAKSPDS